MGITVQDVVKRLTDPVETVEDTVDTLKFGSLNTEVSGIAVTFMPTYTSVQTSIELGANLLIAHEGIFFSHRDEAALGESPGNQVYTEKYDLINESGLAIYRFHDYWHRYQPDGIMTGLVQSLEWDPYVTKHQAAATVLTIPPMTVTEIAQYVKDKLNIEFVRCTGDLSMSCTRVGVLVGYRGGGSQAIPLSEQHDLDLVIYGEGPEWETPEYIRDSVAQGKQRSLIVLGHAESEQPGMKYLADVIAEMFPAVPVHFIPNEPCFKVL
jgi:putative NIF3 family GTP cyclohydrolase 1 type 2